MKQPFKLILGLSFLTFIFFSCRKEEWNKRNKIQHADLNLDLVNKIQGNPDLNSFYELLKKSGLDEVLKSSRSYTVWAPVNAALDQIKNEIPDDSDELKRFVGNYVAFGAYYTKDVKRDSLRVRLLNSKFVTLFGDKMNGIELLDKDEFVSNGVLNTIGRAVLPTDNIWEYMEKNYSNTLQFKFIDTLNYRFVDPDSAEQVGVDAATGEPIYKPGTGLVKRNRFLQRVNINSEDSLVTYVLFTDPVFGLEEQRLKPFFQDTTQHLTDSITKWNVVKDLAFNGLYNSNDLPDILYSIRDSVKYHINKEDIIQQYSLSNGKLFVVKNISYNIHTKIKPVILEGERFFDRMDPAVSVQIRKRRNPVTDSIFNDVLVENYGLSSFWLRYPVNLNSVEYKVYWVAVNDFQDNSFPMKVAFKSHIDTTMADPTQITFDFELPYTTVQPENYQEVYLGNYSQTLTGLLDLYLIGNNVKTNGDNTIVCDYIKLVPILN